jgi:hypothetical protein
MARRANNGGIIVGAVLLAFLAGRYSASPPAHRPSAQAFVSDSTPRYGGGAQRYSAGSVYYRNCSHARALGAAPVMAGEPGYRAGLDRDGDGVGCE